MPIKSVFIYLFYLLCNSNITEVNLRDDGSYLKEGGKCLFTSNFINILNRFI